MRNAGMGELQAGIKIARRNINSLRYDDTTLMTESKEELKRLLMRGEEESEKAGLKLNTKNKNSTTKIMAASPITSWRTEGERVEAVADFLLAGSKITADGDCSYEIRRLLLLGRKAMTNLDSMLKSRDITFPTNSQSYSFSNCHMQMWEWGHKEGWEPKNWCFWTVVLEKSLENPLCRKEVKPVNLKRNQPWMLMGRADAEAEAPVLWPPDERSWFVIKDPDARKDWGQRKGGNRGWSGWMASPIQQTWTLANSRR